MRVRESAPKVEVIAGQLWIARMHVRGIAWIRRYVFICVTMYVA